MGEYHFLESKNYYALKNKLKEFSTLKEKIVFLESEKLNTERVLHHLKNKKLSIFKFVQYKGRMASPNCPELFDISMYIRQVSSRRIDYVKQKFGPMFIFYKYIYIYPVLNFILYREGHSYFKKLCSEYLFLVEQEIKLCEKQIHLGFIETPIKSLEQPYTIKYSPKMLERRTQTRESTRKKFRKEKAEFRRYSKIIIDIKENSIFDRDDIDRKFEIVFVTKKELLDHLKNFKCTKEKLIYLLDVLHQLSRIKTDFAEFKAASFDQNGIYLFKLSHNCPELVYFIEFLAFIFNAEKTEGKAGLSLYELYKQIEHQAMEYQDIITLIYSQIGFFEKRLSLEKDDPVADAPKSQPLRLITNESGQPKPVKKKIQKSSNRITWLGTETQLIDLFFLLSQAKLMPDYSEDEVVVHFVNARLEKFKPQEKVNYQMLKWLGTDEDFPELINKLVDEGFTTNHKKYKSFTQHFLNKEGKEFLWLSQKNHYGKTYAAPNPLIDDAIRKIKEDKQKNISS